MRSGLVLPLTCLAAAALLAGPARAAPRAACEAWREGDRVVVQLALDDFLDQELLELVRLGLTGRLSVDVTLVRRRRFWFDERLVVRPLRLTVAWDAERRRLRLEDAPVEQPGRLRPDPLPLWPGRPLRDGRYVVEIAAQLQVVTSGSLGQVARWMLGGGAPAGRGVLSRVLAEAVAQDLVRADEGECAVAPPAARTR